MRGTRWRDILRVCAGMIYREANITLTPLSRPEKWIFVVGCYNSGTTLLGKILGSHHSISSLPSEGQYLTDQLPRDHEVGLSRMWTRNEELYRLTEDDTGPDVVRLKREWMMRINRTRPFFLERTPANSARTRWLQRHFENAHFIGIIRNPYAVSEGISRKAKPVHSPHGWPIELCAHQWKRTNELLEEDAKHLNKFMWTRYEDLVTASESTVASILEFIGLRNDLKGIDMTKQWVVHERKESIRDLNEESIRRLSRVQIRKINKVAGDVVKHYGYELIEP